MVDPSRITWFEYSILGTILLEGDCAGEVVAALSPEHFSMEATRGLFEAISALHVEGAPINQATVMRKAGSEYEVAVQEACQHYTAKSNLPYYCDLLKEQGRLRQVQAEAMGITSAENLEQAGEVLDRMNGLMVTQKKVTIMSAAEAAMDFYQRQEAKEKPEYLTWGMDKLNQCLYVQLGDFVVVGGYASSGKTLLSLQFALELAQKYRVGYFSLETSPQKLNDRTMAHLARIPLAKIKKRDLNDADWAAIAEASRKLAKMQLEFIDAGSMSVRDIQALSLNRHYQVVIVDYLGLVQAKGKDRYEQVTNISMGLHTLARSHNIAVIALAQLSRPEKEKGKQQPPNMNSFRESGQIEQDADVAILLWLSDPNDNKSNRVLKIAKNKEGERARFELKFDGPCQTLTPVEPTPGEKYRELQKEIRKAGKAGRVDDGQVSFTEIKGSDANLPF